MPQLCDKNGRVCGSYRPGHNMHVIHANHAGRTPWGWRDATVVEVLPTGVVVLAYEGRPATFTVWHHDDLTSELCPGTEVQVHEEYGALAGQLGWISVKVRGGLGAVPAPGDLGPWVDDITFGVVDLGTGRGVELRPGRADVTPSRDDDDDRGSR